MIKENQKEVGVGTSLFLLLVLSIVWALNFKHICVGDIVLNTIGLTAWSITGVHYTVFYSMAILIPAYIVALRYPRISLQKQAKRSIYG